MRRSDPFGTAADVDVTSTAASASVRAPAAVKKQSSRSVCRARRSATSGLVAAGDRLDPLVDDLIVPAGMPVWIPVDIDRRLHAVATSPRGASSGVARFPSGSIPARTREDPPPIKVAAAFDAGGQCGDHPHQPGRAAPSSAAQLTKWRWCRSQLSGDRPSRGCTASPPAAARNRTGRRRVLSRSPERPPIAARNDRPPVPAATAVLAPPPPTDS